MRATLRRFRAEARKLVTPALPVAVIAAVGVIVFMQARGDVSEDLSPTRVDVSGGLRIASMQLATIVGFALVGLLASLSIGDEAGNGSIVFAAIADSHYLNLVVRRVVLLVAVSSVVLIVGALLVRTTDRWVQCEFATCVQQRSSVGGALADVASALLVLVFASCISIAIALYVRSPVITVPTMVALYLVPSPFMGQPFAWLTPTKWIVEFMNLDPRASGHYYLGSHAGDASAGAAAVAGAILLAFASGLALVVSARRIAVLASGGTRE